MRVATPTELGLAIRERRRALGWDQRELAQRVGASRQWVVDLEKGKPGTELGLVMRAVRALELNLFVEPSITGTATIAVDPPRVQARVSAGAAPPPENFDPLQAALERARRRRDDG